MSRPYRTPTLKEQFGLQQDPNVLEHTLSPTGNRLTKLYHAHHGKSLNSTEEHDAFPVYCRRIGNPFPIIFFAFGATLLILGSIMVGARNLTQLNIFIAIGFPLGCIGNLVGSMFAFTQGNTFAATLGSVFGGIIGAMSIIFLPWAGVQGAYLAAAPTMAEGVLELYKALSFVFFIALIPLFLVFLAALRTTVPLAGGAFMICIALILEAVNYLHYPMLQLQTACGAIFIIVGVIMWYLSVAVMNQEEGIMIPVIALPRHDD